MFCLKNRDVWWFGRDDVVWLLYFTFLGRKVCGVVGLGTYIGWMWLCGVLVGVVWKMWFGGVLGAVMYWVEFWVR